MIKKFSSSWKESKKPRKQRKYRYNAPLHVKQKFVSSHISKELRKKYSKRAVIVRKGDTVKIMRGQFKNKTGKVEEVSIKKIKIYVNGIDFVKRDGTKSKYPLHPSNVMITTLTTDDKMRNKSIGRK